MAHTVQNLDKEAHSKNMMLSRLNPPKYEHLKPLSNYSRMITCDQNSSIYHPRKFYSPLINLKIEVVNSCANKRKLDDSTPDDGCKTPVKKPFSAKALSPDLGCFVDYCSPLARQVSVSTFANSNPTLLDKTQALSSKIKETVESGSSADPGGEKETVPHSLNCERFILNPAPAFDFDVDNLLTLSPFGTCAAAGFAGSVDSCKCPSCNIFPNKSVLIPTVAHRHEVERGVGQEEEEREELKKEMCLNVKDEEEDKGYFSMSYINDHEIGRNTPQSVYSQLPPANSSPLLRTGEAEPPEDARHPENSPELQCQGQAVMSGQCFSYLVDNLCPTVSGPLLEPLKFPAECLEGDVEEAWSISPPIFESSMCHSVTVKIRDDQSRQVSEEVQEDATEPGHDCQATVRTGEDTSLDTSCETTLPLQVPVKSEVVVPSQQTASSKPVSPLPPGQATKPTKPKPDKDGTVLTTRSQRPVIFKKEADWEHETKHYVHAVTRHMNENPGGDQGVMSELQDLMTHVAGQTESNGSQWQHPSDLTRRNYQRRFGNTTPKMTLSAWQVKNSLTHKRFAKVPKMFDRSQFP